MSERVLVTGAAGFIGSHACARLLDAGYAVTGIDNFDPYYERAFKQRALAPLAARRAFAFARGDVRDGATVERLAAGADAVLHLAARPGVRQSFDSPAVYASVNVGGTRAVVEACARAGVRRLVVASSSSVYGDAVPAPFREDADELRPVSPYGVSKRAAELLCRSQAASCGLRVAMLRLFTVYGPGQRPDQAIFRFTARLRAGGAVEQYGDGSSERDYTYVDDATAAMLAALRWTAAAAPGAEPFNVGSGRAVRLCDVIALIAARLAVEPRVRVAAPRRGDVRRTHADVTRARQTLHYEPTVPLEEGIRRFVAWYGGRGHPWT